MMMDDHWPSLPPIRTSSYNARVSCETLNSLPPSPLHHHTPLSSSNPTQVASKSVETTPPSTSCPSPQSHPFSHCFPHRFSVPKRATGPGHTAKRPTADPTGAFRSFFGFPAAGTIPRYSSPVVSYSSGISPSYHPASSSATNSPSGRMRSGGTTPVLRSSKGHAAHMFTMIPPDVVGKKKNPDYEADEPTSPEVTCIGRVRRKQQCKAVKDKHKDGKKKGKVRKPAAEITHNAGFVQAVKRSEEADAKPTMLARLSRQRSERRKSFDIEGFLSQCVDAHMPRPVLFDSGLNDGGHDAESSVIPVHGIADQPSIDIHDSRDTTTTPAPQNCLLLMKKGSRHNSFHLHDAPEVGSS